MTTINRAALFVGVSLVTAGTMMLIGLGDAATMDPIEGALQLWPLALIALGAGLLVRQTPYALIGGIAAATVTGLLFGGAVVASENAHDLCADGVASTYAWGTTDNWIATPPGGPR